MLSSTLDAAASSPVATPTTSSEAVQVEAVQVQTVQIASGDSLWSVAETVAPDADPREVIDELVRLNGLEGFDVYPGQKLAIPARY